MTIIKSQVVNRITLYTMEQIDSNSNITITKQTVNGMALNTLVKRP